MPKVNTHSFSVLKIHIGDNIWIREEVWRKITSTTKDSFSVKEMAVALWRTATKKKCVRKGEPHKQTFTKASPDTLQVASFER